MKIITAMTHKGGSGKTTLCRHLAVAAWQAGIATVIIDTDPMGGAREWGARRNRDPFVIAEQSVNPEHLRRAVERCRAGGADLVVIDTAGHQSAMATVAAKMADLTLVPVRPTPDDIDAFWPAASDLNDRNIPFRAVISQCPTNSTRPETDAAYMLTGKGVSIAPVAVHTRAGVPLSGVSGDTILEVRPLSRAEQKSASEFRSLFRWVWTELDGVRVISQTAKERDGDTIAA